MKKIVTTSFAALLMTSIFATGANASTEKQTKATTDYQVQVYSNTMNQQQLDNLLRDFHSNHDLQMIIERIQSKYPNVKVEPVKRQPLQQNQKHTEPSKETIKVEEPKKEQPTAAKPDQPAVNTPTPQQPSQSQPAQSSEQVQTGITAEEQQMVNLVNEERAKVGLPALKVNFELTKVARVKAKDMIDHNYFAHQSPTYGSPFDMLQHYGVSYRTAGENLAGNQTVEGAHRALMNSSGHRANILNHQYTEVGIGIINGGPYGKMFVQLFKG